MPGEYDEVEQDRRSFFSNHITLGNIITIAVLLSSTIYSFSQLATRKELDIAINEVRKEYVSREVQKLELSLISTRIQELDNKVEEIKADVKDIKRVVKQ
jgi:hypothetical protein